MNIRFGRWWSSWIHDQYRLCYLQPWQKDCSYCKLDGGGLSTQDQTKLYNSQPKLNLSYSQSILLDLRLVKPGWSLLNFVSVKFCLKDWRSCNVFNILSRRKCAKQTYVLHDTLKLPRLYLLRLVIFNQKCNKFEFVFTKFLTSQPNLIWVEIMFSVFNQNSIEEKFSVTDLIFNGSCWIHPKLIQVHIKQNL